MSWKRSVDDNELPQWTGIYIGTELIYCPKSHDLAHDQTYSVVVFRLQAANALGLSDFMYSAPVQVSNVCGRTSVKIPPKPVQLNPIKSPCQKLTTVTSLPRIEIDNLVSPCKQYACSRNLPIPSDGFRAERRKWFEMAVAEQAQKKITDQAQALYAQHGKLKPMRKSSI
ncbi:hypothetical protein THRCLA_21784 [Thraustotheca clavata]|uniref:Uncharacterized protein n=1 Tax=Thraustotheca clavata TaxID=74557 RepID=A0A1V9ZPJ9_9STRA|nr:hypothetical protein THRCLA_21784 [Thraustotheca clavata]